MSKEKLKAFDEALKRKKAEADSDSFRQRKRGLSRDQKATETIDRMTKKHLDFYQKNGIDRSEESVRREIASRAERVHRIKDGE